MNNNFIKEIYLDKLDKNSFLHEIDGLKKIKSFDSLSFKKPIIFFTGENGTGKSTLLEAIAINWGFNPEGGVVKTLISQQAILILN